MSWVKEEFESIDVGDQRLNSRFIQIVESFGCAPGKTIPQAFKSWGEIKACYNFFSNDRVSNEKLLAPHENKTIERIKQHPIILLPSDTTEINYSTKEAMVGKERLAHGEGIFIHGTIAVTPERLTLGIVDVNFWHRKPKIEGICRDKKPIEEKESYRWLQSYLRSCEIARMAPERQVINITDREGDIIELFETAYEQAKLGPTAYFITRARHDRSLQSDDGTKIKRKLIQSLKEELPLGEIEFSIPSTEKRIGRKVKQQIKAIKMTLKAESTYKKSKKAIVTAVMAIEEHPPEGEAPLIWFFITNLSINSFEEACNVIKYYLCRWEIEVFFKVLKSGCKIEERQLQTTNRMQALIITFMILAWRVMYTMMLGRVSAEMSAAEVFEESEWKSVYKIANNKSPLPRKPPKLGDFIIMVAKLGGYIDRSNEDPPGVKIMWKGMARMVDFAIAWEAFGK